MRVQSSALVIVMLVVSLGAAVARAESSDFQTVVGHVVKFEKEMLTIRPLDKTRKTIEMKVTGTSKFHLLAPQVRKDKTVITQRSAETSDLMPEQSIAVIYTLADNEPVLLTAVIKQVEKEKKQ